uniref:Uncharacterized protein n=1 Tax=Globodera rostochiensis TaxID=31243 RepID=A0A914I5B9_GLORO
MRDFYYYKLFQAIATYVLLWQILSFDKLCGKFASPPCFVKSLAPAGECKHFGIIRTNTTADELNSANMKKWSQLINNEQAISDDEQNFMGEMVAKFPTGRQCFPVKISMVSAMKNAFYCNRTDHLEKLADAFAQMLYYVLLFLFTLVFHVMAQDSEKEYDFCGYFCAIYGFVIWCLTTAIAAMLYLNWTTHWECTNFRPDNLSMLLFIVVLSAVLMCSSLLEIFCNRSLLHKCSATHTKSVITLRTGNEKIDVAQFKQNDQFIVRITKC